MAETQLWKATCPDGTDFYSGTIDYGAALDSGEVITHRCAALVRNDPSTYFSVSTVPTDCTGMRWPCRLFVVEAVGRAYRNDRLPNKRCCRALRVVAEHPAHEALGPQGEQVAALIERCRTLTMQEARDLTAAYAARGAARDAAWDAARAAARTAAWAAARDAARGAARTAARAAARTAAWGAARDAAWALLTRDLITPEQFNLLYGPWQKVIENG